ncbi:hypothetical protein Btru_073310 [Bulinus truncatus]|nr:hypothetical protein Btru_073310 [Bulinus truncatus]
MEEDESAACFDTIVCQSGQFGFFQKRLFFINTLIQSACISVIVFTCTCMPDIDDSDGCGDGFGPDLIFSNNGYHHNLTSHDDDNGLMGNYLVPAAINSSLDFLLQNLTKLVPTSQIISKLTEVSQLTENGTLVNTLDMVVSNVTESFQFFVNISQDYLSENFPASHQSISSILVPQSHKNDSGLPAGLNIESYLSSVFESVKNVSELRNETFHVSPSNPALPTTSPQTSSFYDHPMLHETSSNEWPHLVDAVLVNLTGNSIVQGYSDLSVMLTNVSTSPTTVVHSSFNVCHKPFILLRTDLKRTQVDGRARCHTTIRPTYNWVSVGILTNKYETADNTKFYETADNTKFYETADNTRFYETADNTRFYETADNTRFYETADNTRFYETADNTRFYETADNTRFYETADNTRFYETADNTRFYETADNTRFYETADNTRFYETADNTRFYETADNTRFYETADNTRFYETADNTRLFKSLYGDEMGEAQVRGQRSRARSLSSTMSAFVFS